MMTSLLTNRFVNTSQGNAIVSFAVLLMMGVAPVIVVPSVQASDDVDVLPGEFTSPAVPPEAQSSSPEAPELAAVRIGAAGPLANLSVGLGRQFKEQVPGANVEISSREVDAALDDVLSGDLDIAAINRPLTANEQALGLTAIPLGAGLFYVFDDSAPSSRIQPFLNFLDDPANESSIQRAVARVRPGSESADDPATSDAAEESDSADPDDADDTEIAGVDTSDGETDAEADADADAEPESEVDADSAPADSETPFAALGDAEAEGVAPVPSNELPDGRPGGVASQRPFPWWWLLLPLLLGLPLVAWLSRSKKSETVGSTRASGDGENEGRGDRPSTGTSASAPPPVAANGTELSSRPDTSAPTSTFPSSTDTPSTRTASMVPPASKPTPRTTPGAPASSSPPARTPSPQAGSSLGKAAAGAALGAAGLAGAMASGKKASSDAEPPATESPEAQSPQKVVDKGEGSIQMPAPRPEATPTESDTVASESIAAESVALQNGQAITAPQNGQAMAPPQNGQTVVPPIFPPTPSTPAASGSSEVASAEIASAEIASPEVASPEPMTAVNDSIRSGEVLPMDAALPVDSATVEPVVDSSASADQPEADQMNASVADRPVVDRSTADSPVADHQTVNRQTADEEPSTAFLGNMGAGAIATGLGAAGLGFAASQFLTDTEEPDAETTPAFAVPPVLYSQDSEDAEGDAVSAPVVSINQFLIQPSDNQEVLVQWEMPEDQQHLVLPHKGDEDTSSLQLKIHDVTGIDLDYQPPHDTQLYEVPASAFDGDIAHMTVPVPLGDRDYLAELGQLNPDHQWMSLGRSLHTYVPIPSGRTPSVPPADDDLTLVMEGADEPPTDFLPIITTVPVQEAPIAPSIVALALADDNRPDLHIQWTVPNEQVAVLQKSRSLPLKMRLYDVTGIDLNAQPAHDMQVYHLDEHATELTLPAPQNNRDYLAELGYETPEGQWQQLGRSLHVHVPETLPTPSPESQIAPFVSEPPPSSPSAQTVPTPSTTGESHLLATLPPFNPATCNQWLTVNAPDHVYSLDSEQVAALQSTAQSTPLDPGSYIITIEEGSFNYWAEHPDFSGEPIALIWLHGGRFINRQTTVETTSTWVSLNGYDDVLNLEVIESTTLHALFLDTYREDNTGQVTLLILKDD